MGFFNALKDILGGGKCPICGTPGARKVGTEIRCFNPTCQYFNPSLAAGEAPPQQPQASRQDGVPLHPASPPLPQARSPFNTRISRDKTRPSRLTRSRFTAKRTTLSPKWRPRESRSRCHAIAFRILMRWSAGCRRGSRPDRIGHPRERQVLNYHKKYKTTSPLYEKIREKYPNW